MTLAPDALDLLPEKRKYGWSLPWQSYPLVPCLYGDQTAYAPVQIRPMACPWGMVNGAERRVRSRISRMKELPRALFNRVNEGTEDIVSPSEEGDVARASRAPAGFICGLPSTLLS